MRPATPALCCLVLVLVLAPSGGAQILVDHTTVDDARIPQTYLDPVRTLDIFFVHASVGMGMVAGLKSLSTASPSRYALTLGGLGTPATWFDTNNGLVENGDWAGLGGNGNPLGKIKGFDELIRNHGYGARADIAFMKFCYIDFMSSTNVAQVWAAYRDTLTALEAAYPKVTFVWLTAALNALGTEGKVRADFNQCVRDHCRTHGKPLFDLAAIESHDPDGNLARDDHGNETIYAGYTDDNGHLAAAGRDRVARALWWLFARIAGWTVAPTALRATAGTPVLAADGAAATEIVVRLHDGTNAFDVSGPDSTVTFSLTGPGSLAGSNPVATAGGVARITFRAGTSIGKARITAAAPGLATGQAEVDLISNRAPDAPANL
ncbi:MAG: hypothetical protein JXQ29_12045, partial [Planctomycetes bacterium]|nr:hypothetical protein [Planctomycetota bacterium]